MEKLTEIEEEVTHDLKLSDFPLQMDMNDEADPGPLILESGVCELNEGVYDPGILKAFFMAGGPGSGKSFLAKRTTGGLGLKMVNSDPAFEKLLRDAGHSLKSFDPKSKEVTQIRAKAKETTSAAKKSYLEGRLGMVIDGTGKDFSKLKKGHQLVTDLGYDAWLFFVETSLEVALERNRKRSRTLPDAMVEKFWQEVMDNKSKLINLFKPNYIVVKSDDPDEEIYPKLWKHVMKVVRGPVKNPLGKTWIKQQLARKSGKVATAV